MTVEPEAVRPSGVGSGVGGGVGVELREFYEAEATHEMRRPPQGRRVAECRGFAVRVSAEVSADSASSVRRPLVLDVGAGPGSDASTIEATGAALIGVDFAVANASLAARRGHCVVPASLFDLPFAAGTFDAVWSMSTLMHVPEAEMPEALAEMRRVAALGAIAGVGVWGGSLGDIVSDRSATGSGRRLFSLRSAETNRRLLDSLGSVERFEVWDAGPDRWEYHFAVVRLD